jgi:hypothetical protein
VELAAAFNAAKSGGVIVAAIAAAFTTGSGWMCDRFNPRVLLFWLARVAHAAPSPLSRIFGDLIERLRFARPLR